MTFPIDHYLNIQMAYAPVFWDGGRRVAFLSNITGIPQLWQVTYTPEQPQPLWPDQLTFEQDRVQGVWAAPDGDALIYARDVGGNENAQLFLLRPGEPVRALTEGHDRAMHIFGAWLPDGQSFLFAANRRDGLHFDFYRQDIHADEAEMVWRHDETGYLWAADVAPDGQRVAVMRVGSSMAYDLLELDLGTGEVRQLNPAGEPARYISPHYGPEGTTLYMLTDLHSDFMYLAQFDREQGSITSLRDMDWDLYALAQSPDRQKLAYAVNENGSSYLEVLDTVRGTVQDMPGLGEAPGVIAMHDTRLDFSTDGGDLVFSYTSATRTSDVFVWNLASDRIQQVTRSSHGMLPVESFVAPGLVHYPTFDEREIPAWLYRPVTQGQDNRLPVVVLVHGGPESQFRPYFNFLVQYLVHNGYAVLAPNVRGSTGYGKAYSHLDDVEKRMDSVADLAHAAKWLKQQPHVDPDRIAVYGGSYGGFMVLSALTTYPDLWASGVDLVGISNFVTFLENTSDYRRAHRESEYGSLERDRDFLSEISPNHHVDQITAPLMVIHGANDPRVPLGEAEQMVAALRERNQPVELLVFDDEGHGIAKLKNKRVAYPAVVAFLDEYVGKRKT